MERDLAQYDPSSNRPDLIGNGAKAKIDMLDREKQLIIPAVERDFFVESVFDLIELMLLILYQSSIPKFFIGKQQTEKNLISSLFSNLYE